MRVLNKALFAAGCLVAATLPAHAKDFTVGLSWNAMDNQLPVKWQEYLQSEGAKQGAAADVNFKWVINVADADPTRQAANIEDLINQGVDMIIARAEDAAAIGASIRAAKEAGIPFMTFDRESSTTKPTVHVGGDSFDQGKTTAEAFVALLKEKGVTGKCIELQGSLTDVNAMNRSKAWHEGTDNSGVVTTVVSVPTEWNPDLFRSGTVNALRANPDANCMFLASDFALSAVQSALEGADRWAPRGEGQVRGDDHRGLLVKPADQVEQQLSTGLGKGQIPEFIQNDEVHVFQVVRHATLAARAPFRFELVDEIDDVEEPASGHRRGCTLGRWRSPDESCKCPCPRSGRRCAGGR